MRIKRVTTQRIILSLVAMVGVGLLAAAPVWAHHAFAAEFDANRPVRVQGTIAKLEWINPHCWFHIDVKTPDGRVERWMFEGQGVAALARRGINKNSMPIGTEVVFEGYLSKGVKYRANARVMQYADGRRIFVGSSGTGAPRDGSDPSEK